MSAERVEATVKLKDKEGNITGEERKVEVDYEFGDSLSDAVEMFGEEAVFNQYRQQARIGLQGILRRHGADPDTTDEQLQEIAAEWKPGEKRATRKSPADKLKDLLSGRDPDEIKAILAEAGLE